MSGIRDQGSGIRDQGSGIRYQVSGIRYQVSGIRYQVSGIGAGGVSAERGHALRSLGEGGVSHFDKWDVVILKSTFVSAKSEIDSRR
jgi:hypothetical protein